MKRLFLTLISAIIFATAASATVLYPFFGDLAPEHDVMDRIDDKKGHEQILYKGTACFGSVEACTSFLEDVLPDDVSKSLSANGVIVYVSPFREDQVDTIDTDNKVSAIYVMKTAHGVSVYYSESDGTQQKSWEAEITSGNM